MEDKKYKSASMNSTAWNKYSMYLLIVLSTVVMYALLTLRAEAEVAIFRSDTYVEQGVEVVNDLGTEKEIQYDYVWTGFKGALPPETVANSILLRFSWSSVTRSIVSEAVIDATTTSEVQSEQEPDDVPVSESSAEEPLIEEAVPPPVIIAPTDIDVEPESVPLPEESSNPSEPQVFEQVLRNQLFAFANAQVEEDLLTDTVATSMGDSSEVIMADSVSTTSGFVSPDIIPVSEGNFFEVRYTTDGATWYVLGRVGFAESQQVTFDISHIGLEALPNLQIAVRYIVPEDDKTKIIFDSMRIEVEYGAPIVEEVVELIVPNDSEPNFEISSIKADVQSENIRAVVLERGGMLEFWYSVTKRSSGDTEWNRLAGGSAIDPDAPIAIKDRTIFWIDRNQQTLFGFSIDEESLFGVPFVNPEDKVFQLPFKGDGSEAWEALFDTELNSLEFHKVRNKSS